jgi:SAM-dependent methyltransferase
MLIARRAWQIDRGICCVCGKDSWFFYFPTIFDSYGVDSFDETGLCARCGAQNRNRAVASVVLNTLKQSENTSIDRLDIPETTTLYLAAANGALYDQLRQKRNCCFSEFYSDLPLGASLGEAQNQDLTALTYQDAVFDLAISEHVLEHVNDPHKAFAELYRILKPGGALIFSIPFEGGECSTTRVTPDGIAVSPKKFHKNPLSSKGSLVFSDFSKNDLVSKYLTPIGFAAEILAVNRPESSIRNSLVIYAVRPTT